MLDGDNVRHGLSSDLGFSIEDRAEHLRRIGELAKLMHGAGMIVLCAFVSPTRDARQRVRGMLPSGDFFEIHCQCPAEICAQRDPKGFYADAKAGRISDYTGVSAPYEAPVSPELALETAALSIEECVFRVITMLQQHDVIKNMPQTTPMAKGIQI